MRIKFSTLVMIFAVILVVILAALLICGGRAECSSVWVLCKPTSGVYIRTKPDKHAPEAGYADASAELKTDGKIRNGFIHVVDLAAEVSEGWIYVGYVSAEKPEWLAGSEAIVTGEGRVACRRWQNGERLSGSSGWVIPGDWVQVFYRTGEWCVTNRGFISTELLDIFEDTGDYSAEMFGM